MVLKLILDALAKNVANRKLTLNYLCPDLTINPLTCKGCFKVKFWLKN